MLDGESLYSSLSTLSAPSFWRGAHESVVFWQEDSGIPDGGVERRFQILRDGQWSDAETSRPWIRLKSRNFAPLPELSYMVMTTERLKPFPWSTRLAIVQFNSSYIPSYRQALIDHGLEPIRFLPDQAFVVRGEPDELRDLTSLPWVRWVGPYEGEDKIAVSLCQSYRQASESRRLTVMLMPALLSDQDRLVTRLADAGFELLAREPWGALTVRLPESQLPTVIDWPEVFWVENGHRKIGLDMDNARLQGGAAYLEGQTDRYPAHFTGVGVRGHVLEGVDPNHPDFSGSEYRQTPIAIDNATPASHGHKTFGILFGNGQGNEKARGILPNGQGLYTNYIEIYNDPAPADPSKGSRYELVGRLVDEYDIHFQTASWGYESTVEYNLRSLEMDQIIFDWDLPITQSQSNSGNQLSRPQAWAKNIISVGAVHHFDNSDPGDDRWDAGLGTMASIGPSSDGRIKPDLVAYFDRTTTTQWGGGYTEFGGTSGATPIIAGYLGLIFEMWQTKAFQPVVVDQSPETLEPLHFATSKALLLQSAEQYRFAGASDDMARSHQGWGFPNLQKLYDNRQWLKILNESVLLETGESYTMTYDVTDSLEDLRISLVYADPPGNIASSRTLVNDLDLQVVAPDGTTYWGNHGLLSNMYSTAGGAPNDRDPTERVLIPNPQNGRWQVRVSARRLVADGHPETPELDADFALVVAGFPNESPPPARFSP
jgi:hypothetical protein